ncbi:MAG: hypothetical protein HKO56_04700 [Bacteroidia bacterium]|nr:hypothetical protein [Bacteroidia bacterium]NNC85362.1 hypothetical protein [Bacteroidia bacterium]NNM15937.1 hypothetical protein [Bacteroidia bacterium]
MKKFRSFFLICFTLSLIFSCGPSQEPPLNLNEIDWKIYRNRVIGFEFKFPATFTYEVKDMGHNVFLKHNETNTLLVRYCTEVEGREKGLWFGTDEEEKIIINDHEWTKYVYAHGDGPLVSITTSYVTPQNDRYLGIEFRTNVANADFQEFVMNSFKFLEPEEPRRVNY